MNLLRLSDGPAGPVVGGTPGPAVPGGKSGDTLLGVRPEDVRLAAADGVPVHVTAVEYLGADSIVTCNAGTETLAVRVPGRVALAPGAPTAVTWSPESVHLFDEATGRRHNNDTVLERTSR